MPKLLNTNFVDKENKKQTPIMLHRAIIGSLERFIGILIEHYSGKLPMWLSPIQIVFIPILQEQQAHIKNIRKIVQKFKIRSKVDLRNEKIGFKIREYSLKKIPLVGFIGIKEQILKKITLRKQNGISLGTISIDALLIHLLTQINKKG